MASPPDPRQPTADGVGCLVCYLLLMGLLGLPILLVQAADRLRQPPPPTVDTDAVEAELAAFARAVCPGIQDEIDTLTDRERGERQRVEALAELLTKLGRRPADDPDYATWSRQRDATSARLAAARRDREEQFLQARKAALSKP